MKPKFYAAGANSVWKVLDVAPEATIVNELIPFLAVRNKIDTFAKPRNSWFVDSSAYSIYTTGANVTLDDYIQFLHKLLEKYGDKIALYAGLDVIGDPDAGDVNQLRMEAAGLKPLATYHRGDSIDFLKKFLDRGYEYIAIGGMAIADEYTSAESLFPFLDSVFKEICDEQGRPRIKTHLFGIGAPKAIMRYPCASYDSTHWLQPGAFGSVMIPKYDPLDGTRQWFETMVKVPISKESNLYRKPGAHYKSLKPGEQEEIKRFVETFGFTVEGLRESYEQRNLWNLRMALEVNQRLPACETFKNLNDVSFNFL